MATGSLGWWVLVAMLTGLEASRGGEADTSEDDSLQYAGPTRSGDSMWLLDTRDIKNACAGSPGFVIQRHVGENWEAAELAVLSAESKGDTKTVIYVHGYDFTPEKAKHVGWAVYHTLARKLPDGQHLRLLIWSWPANSITIRMVRDMKQKARRTNSEAYFLAWLLSRVDVDAVIGSAMGCRIVSGSFHLLAGKSTTLNTVVKRGTRQDKLRAILISPALDDDWLLPGKFHGKALSQVKQMLLLNNSMDPLLANYAMISKGDSVALGVVGVATEHLGKHANRLRQQDVSGEIGQKHGVENYLRASATGTKICRFILSDE